jgi:hypothetical protein
MEASRPFLGKEHPLVRISWLRRICFRILNPMKRILAVCGLSLLCSGIPSFGQSSSGSSGTVRGSVLDPSGAAIAGATVDIRNPVSGYVRGTITDNQGKFQFDNLPFNPYHVSSAAPRFQSAEQDVDVKSPIPLDIKFSLKIGTASTTVEVTADAKDLIEVDPVSHTDIDRGLFDKLPLESQSSSLSSLVTLSAPGATADSDGLFHGMGDHAQNSFSVDGQKITDQQSKVFSNQIPVDSVQSMEVIQGAPPAEYGDKTSLVIVVTTRSGLAVDPAHGELTGSYGTFGTGGGGFNLAYGEKSWGNFVSVSGMDTGRFLDGPEFTVMHDHGNQGNVFDRVDIKPSQADTININFGYTRSWFQTPNSFDGQDATAWSGVVVDNGGLGPNGKVVGPQDQRSKINTLNVAPTWTHLFGAHTLFTLGGFVRRDGFNYYPSANPFSDLTGDLQSETFGQNRTLTNVGGHADLSYVNGIHNIKTGIQYDHTFLTEKDAFGIVDPTLNPVCLNADGSPFTGPSLMYPSLCTGQLQANPNFVPLLGCIDLTRTGKLPAGDGCPTSNAALYNYYGHADIKELALYFQDSISIRNWSFNLGLRGDFYNGLASARQIEPRLGIAYNIKPTNTVLRVSYARTLETPFNENLVISSLGCNDAVVNAVMSTIGNCNPSPLGPGWRNEFHAGLQQAFGRFLVVDGEYIWKYTHRAYDFSVFGSTPLTFPIEWASSKIPGYAVRASMPTFHGLSAFVVFSSVAARFFTPQISGIGSAPGGSQVFRIDHDENFNQTTHLQYQFRKTGPWLGFNWRYDSGLVAGPIPCAGGNCNNGPNGTDSVVDFSGLTPDQQFQAGLFCGSAHATPTTSINDSGLCPGSQFGSTLIKIPAPGTEDDDHNPPRIAPRNLFDLAVGHDNIFHGEKHKWSVRVAVVNLTNSVALYNFLSTFSGTHYVTPRTITATIGFHF